MNATSPIGFESVEQKRAWNLAIERGFKTVNQVKLDHKGFLTIQRLADEGNLIAQGFMLEFTKARLAG